MAGAVSSTSALTPLSDHGLLTCKRDDAFAVDDSGANGGKVRALVELADSARARGVEELVCYAMRQSSQPLRMAAAARLAGLAATAFVPAGPTTPLMAAAAASGADVRPVAYGRLSVLRRQARVYTAERPDRLLVPFGVATAEAIALTAGQVANLPSGISRIVVTVGSGTTLAGIVHGLDARGLDVPVVGVQVGGKPAALESFGLWERPSRWPAIVPAGVPYEHEVEPAWPEWVIDPPELDPIYEAKCVRWLEPGDLFWIVGGPRAYLAAAEVSNAA